MPKQYLRYSHSATFGVVVSRKAGAVLLQQEDRGRERRKRRLVVAPALENVILWNIRTGEKVGVARMMVCVT